MEKKDSEENSAKRIASILRSALEGIEEEIGGKEVEKGSNNVESGVVVSKNDQGRRFVTASTEVQPRNQNQRYSQTSSSRNSVSSVDIAKDFRNAFPSMGGGGRRLPFQSHSQPKKARKGNSNSSSNYSIFIPPRETCTRDFCLLSKTNDDKVPTFAELQALREAGLGRKKVVFPNKKANHDEVRKCLEESFPKICSQDGAFEFLKAERGGKFCPLTVIPMSSKGYTAEYIREMTSPGSIIYIRPMQENICRSKVESGLDNSLVTKCKECNKAIPINLIRAHLSSCVPVASADSKMPVSVFLEQNHPDGAVLAPSSSANSNNSSTDGFEATRRRWSASATLSSVREDDHDEWNRSLSSLFPDLEEEEINQSLIGAGSLDEAANALIDSADKKIVSANLFSNSVLVTSKQPPTNLDSFLNSFTRGKASEDYEELSVNRDRIWRDAMKYYKRKINDPSGLKKTLEISFEGEDGLDGGAMRAEFFQLVFNEVTNRLFEGDVMNFIPVKDSSKLFLFRMTGMLIVHVILQDGPLYAIPPLAPAVAESVLGGTLEEIAPQLSKHHIPLSSSTELLHEFIEGLDTAKAEHDIEKLMEKDDNKDVFWQLVNSCHWSITKKITMVNKNLLIQELIFNELVSSRKQEIGELQAGLDTLGFLMHAKQHREFAKEILCYSNELRKPFGVEEFKSIVSSDPASFEQKQALAWLYEYLEEEKESSELVGGSRLTALLQFCTGHRSLPKNGFRTKIKIQFLEDDDEHQMPTSSACLHILRLPTVHSSKPEFFRIMEIALKYSALGFPNP